VITSKQPLQVIVATHSPTIVESATFEELFLLRPVELVASNENQLLRVASDEERLSALRALFGSTHNLTSMLPVVIVESVSNEQGRAVPDRQLYRALHSGGVLLPLHAHESLGKTRVRAGAKCLQIRGVQW
jgi:hypothetical protein